MRWRERASLHYLPGTFLKKAESLNIDVFINLCMHYWSMRILENHITARRNLF
jgi:hypothetical protein